MLLVITCVRKSNKSVYKVSSVYDGFCSKHVITRVVHQNHAGTRLARIWGPLRKTKVVFIPENEDTGRCRHCGFKHLECSPLPVVLRLLLLRCNILHSIIHRLRIRRRIWRSRLTGQTSLGRWVAQERHNGMLGDKVGFWATDGKPCAWDEGGQLATHDMPEHLQRKRLKTVQLVNLARRRLKDRSVRESGGQERVCQAAGQKNMDVTASK